MMPFYVGRNAGERLPVAYRTADPEVTAKRTEHQHSSKPVAEVVRCEVKNPTEVIVHLDQRRALEPFSEKVLELSWRDIDRLSLHPSVDVVILDLETFGEAR